jgi:hypothetical protein
MRHPKLKHNYRLVPKKQRRETQCDISGCGMDWYRTWPSCVLLETLHGNIRVCVSHTRQEGTAL